MKSTLTAGGDLTLKHQPAWPSALEKGAIREHGFPRHGLGVMHDGTPVKMWRARNARHLSRGLRRVGLARALNLPTLYGALYLDVYRDGVRYPLGLASLRVVTTTGVGYIVDAFQNLVELENMKFHGFGTGGAAEAVGNTALTTELTTEYATDNTRPTGTTTENGATVYQTVATLDPDSAVAITEHGIFSQAATGGGVMIDRTLFSVINLAAAGDTLAATYELTFAAGG